MAVTRLGKSGVKNLIKGDSMRANDATYIATTTNIFPYLRAYKWSATNGWGSSYFIPPSAHLGNITSSVEFSPSGNDIAVGTSLSPYVHAFPWSDAGFGTKYSNPATLPTGSVGGGQSLAFSPSGKTLAVGHVNAPYATLYRWDNGFGTKHADPLYGTDPNGASGSNGGVDIGGSVVSLNFSPAGNALGLATIASPYIQVFGWSDDLGWRLAPLGTGPTIKYSNPTTLPTGAGWGVKFSPLGDSVAIGHTTTPFISAYPWNASTGFGTKYADPSTLPASNVRGISFSPKGDAIAAPHISSPYVSVYPWSSSTGFGTKYADPSVLPTGNSAGWITKFSPSGDAIFVAGGNSAGPQSIYAYAWSSTGFGTKYADAGWPSGYQGYTTGLAII